jgi:hypothetical protein
MKDVVSELSVKIPGLKRKMQNVLQSVWRQVPVTD